MSIRQISAISLALLLCSACATVTVRPDGGPKVSSEPTFESSYSYFVFGLVGEHRIDVDKICPNQTTEQLQTQFTFVDGLFSFLTFGLYAPKTAKVWCK